MTRVYIILGKGFEEIEAITPGDILRRGAIKVYYAAVGKKKLVMGAHGISIQADVKLSDVIFTNGDYIVIPGGMSGVNSIKTNSSAMKTLRAAINGGANIAAICAGPSVLAQLGLLEGRRITCYPGLEEMMTGALCDVSLPVVKDGKLITGRAPGAAIDFALALVAEISSKELLDRIKKGLVY
ncbi:MAG: DJ-1/PfpI family protein [Oscillospiraceae bacterium]|jgi:4-methyl-5(b-hydroxyethyl)-thiazole monophosphate biosynthesis|nr:DJ-1/PfpI family protein [Oscillospiraceae bacterium]